ncbi:hypothetical protein ACV334_34685, partial [Pseudomonas aeruginosa]
NYIPLALQSAIFERQNRRHQNLLITSAMNEENQMLKISYFRTVEQLHEFLKFIDNYLFESELEAHRRETSDKITFDIATLSRL